MPRRNQTRHSDRGEARPRVQPGGDAARTGGKPKRGRTPYRRDRAPDLLAIEARRQALGVSRRALCERADIAEETYRRMRRAGLAFPRQIVALRMALRELVKQQKAQDRMYRVEAS